METTRGGHRSAHGRLHRQRRRHDGPVTPNWRILPACSMLAVLGRDGYSVIDHMAHLVRRES
jgi:hypothetical protein